MNDPRQTSHPDHPMYQQIERGVHAIDAAHGRTPDQTSARLTAALLPLAKEGGLSRVDHVLMSEANNRGVHGGENVFVVQGDPAKPGTSARAHENRTSARHTGRTVVRARAATRRAERASAAARTHADAAAQLIERLTTSGLARHLDDAPGRK